MKWSIFNTLFKAKQNTNYILFNSLSGTVLELTTNDYNELINIKNNTQLLNQYSNKKELIKKKIFVENDEFEINKKQLITIQNRFQTNILNLTIVPTLMCNFKCIYCFQNDINNNYILNHYYPTKIEKQIF